MECFRNVLRRWGLSTATLSSPTPRPPTRTQGIKLLISIRTQIFRCKKNRNRKRRYSISDVRREINQSSRRLWIRLVTNLNYLISQEQIPIQFNNLAIFMAINRAFTIRRYHLKTVMMPIWLAAIILSLALQGNLLGRNLMNLEEKRDKSGLICRIVLRSPSKPISNHHLPQTNFQFNHKLNPSTIEPHAKKS